MRSWMQEAAPEASNVFIHCCYITGRYFAVTHHWVELTLSSTVEPKQLCTVLCCRQELWRTENFLLFSSRREDFLALLNSAMMDRDIKGKIILSLDHYYNVQKNKTKIEVWINIYIKNLLIRMHIQSVCLCVYVCDVAWEMSVFWRMKWLCSRWLCSERTRWWELEQGIVGTIFNPSECKSCLTQPALITMIVVIMTSLFLSRAVQQSHLDVLSFI